MSGRSRFAALGALLSGQSQAQDSPPAAEEDEAKKSKKTKDADGEEDDDDDAPSMNDGDDSESDAAARDARARERARAGRILGHPAAAGRVELAAELVCGHGMSSRAAVMILEAAPAAGAVAAPAKRDRLDQAMAGQERVDLGDPGPTAATDDDGWTAAMAKAGVLAPQHRKEVR